LGFKGEFVKNKNTPPAPLKRGARTAKPLVFKNTLLIINKISLIQQSNSPLERG
jgi:hypothetical protein